MPTGSAHSDLHGSAPDTSPVCLLVIDMINEFAFPEAEGMLPAVHEAATRIAGMKRRAKAAGVPVIYVNDNFGKWQYDFKKLISHCLAEGCRGKAVAELLCPEDDDYFVLKPKHSGFFSTPLELLLKFLNARRLILTGVAGNSCVLATANDAYMRDFELAVPSDCIVSVDHHDNRAALEQMRKMLKADVRPSAEFPFRKEPPA